MVDMNLEPIRAIARGLMVLRVISREKSLNMKELAEATGLPYPTACRIVRTLIGEGYVEELPDRKIFRVTRLVQTLSHGFHEHGDLIEAGRPHIVALTERFHWPVVIATRLGLNMIVRDSTHSLTTRSLNRYYSGFLFPLFDSAAGLAFLAFADEKEKATCIEEALMGAEAPGFDNLNRILPKFLQDIKEKGYATRDKNMFTLPMGKNSSIAAPIILDGIAHGAIAINYLASAISTERAISLYLDYLLEAADSISIDLVTIRKTVSPIDAFSLMATCLR